DKSVSVLDTACAKVAIGQGATPAPIEDATRRIQSLSSEIDSLERETATGAEHGDRLDDLKAKREETEKRLAELNEQWVKEKELTEKIKTIRTKLEMGVMEAKLPAAAAPADGGEAAAEATAETAAEPAGDSATATATASEPVDAEFLKGELKKLTSELKEVQGESP